MSVDKAIWYGLFYKKRIGVKYAHLWIDWANYTEEQELSWSGAWGIYEEAKKFVIDPDECVEIDRSYQLVFFCSTAFEILKMNLLLLRIENSLIDSQNGINKVCKNVRLLHLTEKVTRSV